MKLKNLITCCLLMSIKSSPTFAQNPKCAPFPKEGKFLDTVTIVGYPAELVMFPTGGNPVITYLENKYYIKKFHKFSSLKVTFDACPTGYWMLLDDNSEQAQKLISKKTQRAKLTCVIYRKVPITEDRLMAICIKMRPVE